jgi:arylsulfatase A-like enzyme
MEQAPVKKKLIFVLFDSLVRNALGAYGGDAIPTPNFDRFAKRAVTFDNHWVGSMPCMPARRELHTGRYNFLHRGWGPMEPFDESAFETLGRKGAYSHLITDHFHYFEDGGATYHTRYSSWSYIRGQECDKWMPVVNPDLERYRKDYDGRLYDLPADKKRLTHCITRDFIKEESDFPGAKCFAEALDFLELNRDADNWVLQVECFDPHEPFFAPEIYRKLAGVDETRPIADWPRYGAVAEDPETQELIRANYEALLRFSDDNFGKLLNYMDANDLWADTALVVSTDHGFLLGEHDMWAKNRTPHYNEVAHIPLMIYTPETRDCAGRRCGSLTQTIDLPATILDYFGVAPMPAMTGRSLLPALTEDVTLHSVALYGIFGGSLNITDGRYTYFDYPADMSGAGLYEYTLMPCHMNRMFSEEQLRAAELVPPFDFTKGAPLLRIPALRENERTEIGRKFLATNSVLYDLATDPQQLHPVDAPAVVARLLTEARAVAVQHDAPPEVLGRFGL